MVLKTCDTISINIWLSGDIDVIKQSCRVFCFQKGLCVTVTKTTYIYTGGQEDGVVVGLRNYPRFPKGLAEMKVIARGLAHEIVEAACQHTCMVEYPDETLWISKRGDDDKGENG